MSTSRGVAIVGAGLAGARVATHLREHGYTAPIRMIGDEPILPYDRPVLSKKFMTTPMGAQDFELYEPGHFDTLDVEVQLKSTVVSVNPACRSVQLGNGSLINYDALVWCAGGRARRIDVNGADSRDVYYLRTAAEAAAIRDRAVTARRAVVVGGGFTGLEVAASLRSLGVEVTVLEVQPALLTRVTSEPISQFLLDLHTRNEVRIRCNTALRAIDGDQDGVRGVVVDDGVVLPCDMVVVGVGIVPNVEPLASAGARVSNGVDVDERGRTSLDRIYAAGDCVNFTNRWTDNLRMRLESVQSAGAQATLVAADIVGIEPADPEPVPWFWSHQHDARFQAVGLHHGHDRQILRHNAEAHKISVIYLAGDAIVAADTVNNVRDYAQARKLIERGARLDVERLGDINFSLNDLVR